jgi:catechol 2,3-dioxygenase-like lactoylglutathione lyase family enzyme
VIPPALSGLYETVIYVEDLDAARDFYERVLGLAAVPGIKQLAAAFALPDGGMLLIFDPNRSVDPSRDIPPHGVRGEGHLAFRASDLDAWLLHLEQHAIAIELDHTWPQGGRSVYVRDPGGNSVEFVEGEIWPRPDRRGPDRA